MAVQLLPNTKNDLIISLVQKELKEKTMLLPTIEDFSQFAGKGDKTVNVPKLTSFVAANRTFGGTNAEQSLTDSTDQIALNHNAYIKWIEDHKDHYQSTIEYRVWASQRAAAAHARYVDGEILTVLNGAASLNINGGTAADITLDDILDMREHLLGTGNAEKDMINLVVGPDMEKAMLKIPEFTRADIYGSSNIPMGMIGRVYGVPVMISNLMPTQQAYMYEKTGVGIAFQSMPAMDEEKAIDYGTGGVKVVIDQLFGIAGLQLGVNGASAVQSPLIAKLAD